MRHRPERQSGRTHSPVRVVGALAPSPSSCPISESPYSAIPIESSPTALAATESKRREKIESLQEKTEVQRMERFKETPVKEEEKDGGYDLGRKATETVCEGEKSNGVLEGGNCRHCLELKKKWNEEKDAADELRIRNSQLECEKIGFLEEKKSLDDERGAIAELREENQRLSEEKRRAEAAMESWKSKFSESNERVLRNEDVGLALRKSPSMPINDGLRGSAYQMAHCVNPGPEDPSVLELQHCHVSQHIWNGADDRILRVRRLHSGNQIDKHESPPDIIIPYLQQAGLLGVAHMGYCAIDHFLISSLVERWRPETHTFHMPTGECTITLEDISIISGLPIDGNAVTGRTHDDWLGLCERLLGVQPPRREYAGARIRMPWLAELLRNVPTDDDDEVSVQQYARAYLLRVIGGILFPDLSGSFVHLMLLPLLEDFATAGTYSWGSAALAYLYRELCKATDYEVHGIAGPCIILQFWAWHRFPRLAPSLADPIDDALWHNYRVDRAQYRPLGFKWNKHKLLSDSQMHVLHFYRHFFDNLKKSEIVWQPYTEDLLAELPEFCTAAEDIRRSVVPLIYFFIVEWHQPDRVMRQFGLDQHIPAKPQQPEHLHNITLTGKTDHNWPEVHKVYIAYWNDRRMRTANQRALTMSLTARSEYMKWYKKITRRWISRTSTTLGVVADIAEQQHLWSTDPRSAFNMEKLRISAESILYALQEHDRVSREQLQVAPPSMTDIPPPPEDDNQGSKPRCRRRTGLADGRKRVRDIDSSKSSSQQTTHPEIITTASHDVAAIPPSQPPLSPHPPPHNYPYSYQSYPYPQPSYSYHPPRPYPYPPSPPYPFKPQIGTSSDLHPRPPTSDAHHYQ